MHQGRAAEPKRAVSYFSFYSFFASNLQNFNFRSPRMALRKEGRPLARESEGLACEQALTLGDSV